MKRVILTATIAATSLASTAHAEDYIGAEAATAFVEQQFADYFTDCAAFVDSFATQPRNDKVQWSQAAHAFKYCDGQECFGDPETLYDACIATEGSPNVIHSLKVVPSSTNPFAPTYEEIAVKGKQTVMLTFPGAPSAIPFCFDFVITEELQLRQGEIRSTEWVGYYSVIPGAFCE